MKFVRVLGILLIVAVGCRWLLVLIAGHPPGPSAGRYLGEIVGGGLFIFLTAAIGAGVAAYVTRGRGDDFPGLQTGLAVALAFSLMLYVNS